MQTALKEIKGKQQAINSIIQNSDFITKSELLEALSQVKYIQYIGSILMRDNLISEDELLRALSHVKCTQYVENSNLEHYNLTQLSPYFDKYLLKKLLAVPILKDGSNFTFAFCDNSPMNAQTILRETYNITINAVFMSQSAIEKAIVLMYDTSSVNTILPSTTFDLYYRGTINYEQVIIVRNYQELTGSTEVDILIKMGLFSADYTNTN